MTVIVTVHGTGAGDSSNEGQQWWQLGSEFQGRLAGWLDFTTANVRFEPFRWEDGPNSESKRRNSGRALFKVLKGYEKAGDDYILIGHSHGGSVIHHALMEASMRRTKLPRLKRWITIGTPFIWTRPHRLMFNRLGHFGKVLYVMALGACIGLLTGIPLQYFYGKSLAASYHQSLTGAVPSGEILELQIASQFVTVPLMTIAIYFLVRFAQRHMRRRYSETTKAFFRREFGPLWRSLRSDGDEAIGALRAVRPMKLSLFRRNVLTQPAKSSLVFVFVAYTALSAAATLYMLGRHGFSAEGVVATARVMTFLTGGLLPTPNVDALTLDPIDVGSVIAHLRNSPPQAIGMAASLVLGLPIVYGVLWLIFGIIHIVAYGVGMPVSWFLNTLTANQLRDEAFGNDTIGERVHRVEARPEDADFDCPCVPSHVEEALSSFTAKFAGAAVARARDVLGLSAEIEKEGSIAQTLAKQLTGNELIHTAYFEVDEFAKLVALALSEAGSVPLSAAFQRAPDGVHLRAWYASTQPQPLAALKAAEGPASLARSS